MQKVGPRIGGLKWARHNAIKQGLSNILGTHGAVSIIINFNLDAYEDDPEAFHKVLSTVFQSRAEVLEKAIIKELYGLMGQHFESPSAFDFATQMNLANEHLSAKEVQ
jgi:hypothetical protein